MAFLKKLSSLTGDKVYSVNSVFNRMQNAILEWLICLDCTEKYLNFLGN